ncbi:MAG: flagellar assembly protein FliH [Treponema sp.]|jgi:flagellar assembly protein FliH|nr:flagellar assembly protein FliH [Treponema sp.]
MAKAVYRPLELEEMKNKMLLNPPTAFEELAHLIPVEEAPDDALEEQEKYTGPTADDLRHEAEAYKIQWEAEKDAMYKAARAEAKRIVKEAEDAAYMELKSKTDEAEILKKEAQEEADRVIAEASSRARQVEADCLSTCEAHKKEAEEQGLVQGKEAGFAWGKAEVERLVERTRTMLERAQDKRGEILVETEQEIIDLVLLITRKVVKAISDNQRGVVVSNVVQALRKIKSRGTIIIRVNMADLKLSTEHLKDFIKLVEGAKSVQVVEDSTVDSGGCIIETDFGEIDARIASQLAELEAKIMEISPLTSRAKAPSKPEGV